MSTKPAGIYISTLTVETREQGVKYVGRRSGVFIISFEDILHLVLVFLLLTYSG